MKLQFHSLWIFFSSEQQKKCKAHESGCAGRAQLQCYANVNPVGQSVVQKWRVRLQIFGCQVRDPLIKAMYRQAKCVVTIILDLEYRLAVWELGVSFSDIISAGHIIKLRWQLGTKAVCFLHGAPRSKTSLQLLQIASHGRSLPKTEDIINSNIKFSSIIRYQLYKLLLIMMTFKLLSWSLVYFYIQFYKLIRLSY